MNAVIQEKQPQTVADMMARMFAIRDRKRELEEETKALNEEWEAIEASLMAQMNEQGSTRVATGQGTAILSETIVPQVEDWESFIHWARDNDALHMIQRRVSSPAYREMVESGQEVPGLTPFMKRSINLRAATK